MVNVTKSVTDSKSVQPFKVTLLREGERLWIDEPERLAVAMQNGEQSVPVVFYFHAMSRMACGVQSSACQARLCDAAIAGGGDASICNRSAGQQQSNHQSGNDKNALLDIDDTSQIVSPPSTGATSPPGLVPRIPMQPPTPPISPSTASPS